MPESPIPAYITSLIRHFEDLRDGTHGGSASRKDKEAHFEKAVQLLGPIARQVLTEMNTSLLLDTGHLTETGLRRTADGGLNASWALTDDGRCDENPDQDLKQQELEKITNAEAVIATQRTLQPVHYQAPVSARQRLLDQIGHLYVQSANTGLDCTFS